MTDQLFHAVRGKGGFLNESPIKPHSEPTTPTEIRVFADESLKSSQYYEKIQNDFRVNFKGGAVVNVMNIILCDNGTYFKFPKKAVGGCAIWDLAAVSLILTEVGGVVTDHLGHKMTFNNPDTIYFNKSGFLMASNQATAERTLKQIHDITAHSL